MAKKKASTNEINRKYDLNEAPPGESCPWLFGQFQEWAADNCVDLEHKEDWEAWWICYYHGAKAGVQAVGTAL